MFSCNEMDLNRWGQANKSKRQRRKSSEIKYCPTPGNLTLIDAPKQVVTEHAGYLDRLLNSNATQEVVELQHCFEILGDEFSLHHDGLKAKHLTNCSLKLYLCFQLTVRRVTLTPNKIGLWRKFNIKWYKELLLKAKYCSPWEYIGQMVQTISIWEQQQEKKYHKLVFSIYMFDMSSWQVAFYNLVIKCHVNAPKPRAFLLDFYLLLNTRKRTTGPKNICIVLLHFFFFLTFCFQK